ncbi:hypothetical protein F5Y15DRAFT_122310 [Xylariaceae sp. FL0016]|nr:hypothetical protein F5Y15DRAFT_122310 [Xylariaceae sp. FL0016]
MMCRNESGKLMGKLCQTSDEPRKHNLEGNDSPAEMDWTPKQLIASLAVALATIGVAWLWKLNRAMKTTPPEVLAASPHRWTKQEIKDTYARIKANPIDWARHLPPKLDRRYVVTGGCGGVGGQMVLDLLARGQSPESIRIIDFRKPDRSDMLTGPVTQVDFAQADISSAAACKAAFDKPWAPGVAGLPLTVFHTAAMIAAASRSWRTYDRIKSVNLDGAVNVLEAAKAAGASVFITTSSASVNYRPVQYWGNPFRRFPRNIWQVIDESDWGKPLRPRAEYFGNYAHTKASAERIICQANCSGFRTGSIRPANAIYGNSKADQAVGLCLRSGTFPSWMPPIVQNFVHGGHISLAHLLFEAVLVQSDEMPKCAGRPFVITDAGPPPKFEDMYRLLETTVDKPRIKVIQLQPGVMLAIAHVVEAFDIMSRMPVLQWVVPRPKGDLAMLQPAVFSAGTHYLATDAAARKSVLDGGLGFKHVHDTMEGMCQQALEWNIDQEILGPQNEKRGVKETVVQGAKNVGTMPAVVSG